MRAPSSPLASEKALEFWKQRYPETEVIRLMMHARAGTMAADPHRAGVEFFSSPKNLAKITPGDMGFVIREPFDNAHL